MVHMGALLRTIIQLIWGLWLGGLVMLFFAVQALFDTFPQRHDIAGQGASAIFHVFGYFHLALAAAALLLIFGWRMMGPGRFKIAMFVLFALAAVAAVYVTAVLTPHLEQLRQAGATQSEKFRQLHGLSMGIFLIETLLVFIAGLLLPGATHRTDQAPASVRPQSS